MCVLLIVVYLYNKLLGKTLKSLSIIYVTLISIVTVTCTIGRTSRATFGIPSKHLNITIYPILGKKFVLRNVIGQTIFRIVSAVTILKTISVRE